PEKRLEGRSQFGGLLRQTSIFARARLPALKVAPQDRSAMICPPDGLERIVQMRNACGVVNSSLMDTPREQSAEALQSALLAARENENRWVGMSPEFSSDSERMEQWTSTAKLRRLEAERIEALLAKLSGQCETKQ
ncbi:MAG: hypothetical protein P4K80_04275, partial [Acidobacteriaceae bacterium]|nr:hypothetical protein [Acidobacteriaceae bacterium]